MLSLGVYFYVRSKRGSTADFFVGGRSIPFWAAGVSIYATNTSSISYVATPAKAFETDWQYMTGKLVTVIGLMFVAVWVVPLLRRLNLVSVFNYLELRFNSVIRMLASALCMTMHVGARMSVVLFLPALAIATITGIDVVWSILLMGVCTIVYTTMGGMRAVVWTDFFQVIVLMGGALFAIGYVFYSLGGAAIYETATAYDKTRMLNFSLDLTQPTVWGFALLILFDTVLTFPKDQVLMQRTLATSSDKNAGRSIWVFAAVLLPGGLIFYVIGTVLFAFYKAHPERMDPLLPIDATFPLFIAAELPTGVTGLIIAGIFAAAMGTLSSTINSVATLLSVDFYEKLAKQPTQQKSVRFAEWMSVVIGVIGIGLALLLSMYDIHSLLDLTIELAGLLGGGFAGAYTLGMFTKRANSGGVAIGIATAIVVTVTAWVLKLVHPYFYLGISILTSIVVGYCASYLFPAPTRSLEGLTILRGDARAAALSPEVER
jgi:SSS family transporter